MLIFTGTSEDQYTDRMGFLSKGQNQENAFIFSEPEDVASSLPHCPSCFGNTLLLVQAPTLPWFKWPQEHTGSRGVLF